MTKPKWTLRLGLLGAVLSIAILAISTCRAANRSAPAKATSASASGTAPAASH